MNSRSIETTSATSHRSHRAATLRWVGVIFALVFPTIITWGYFVCAGRYSTGAQQAIYPDRQSHSVRVSGRVGVVRAARTAANWRGQAAAACCSARRSALLVVGAGWLLFDLRAARHARFLDGGRLDSRQDRAASASIQCWKYVVLAVFYSLFHSLLEEYYWRWFVFRQLRRLDAAVAGDRRLGARRSWAPRHRAARVLSKTRRGSAWLLSSAVAIGGAFWAWLYDRTGSLFGPWLSHLLIDAGIFFGVGYDLFEHTFAVAS